ncbi:PAS domain-containing sensor histidine kinase [Dyadobacter luticola]|uniref:histidine kinase n=1 Tax=Dyadobacter luticola TaxID=1979387 RepID=A0A5R9KYP7_9BACT|nr:ATP-binding protein [Dyadobacter luticola]TLV01442.1 PAS domain S-box protein [Dyadobacter luticola]
MTKITNPGQTDPPPAGQASQPDVQAIFAEMMDDAPVSVMVMTGSDHIISFANQCMVQMLGKGDWILGKPARDAMPEIAVQPYLAILDHVLLTGKTFKAEAMPGDIHVDGITTTHYYDFTYKVLKDSAGAHYGILAIAIDVTAIVKANQLIESSENARKEVELENQIKTAVLDNCELIIGISPVEPMPEPMFNNKYTLAKLGWAHNKGRTLIDAVYPADRDLVLQILPEIVANKGGSREIRLWNEVTGEPFWVQWNVFVIDDAVTGEPSILATVSPDITDRKEQQMLLEQQKHALLNAIDVAQLGTWSMDIATRKTTFSRRHLEIFGITDDSMSMEEAIKHVVGEERQSVVQAFFKALSPGSDGKFEIEYTIRHAQTGEKRIIHSKGQTNLDASGEIATISGIAQDITESRNVQLALEAQVRLRTQELHISNKNLEAGNEKLKYANQLLNRSNDDLHRFAYVASHDLQEPLRKIQQFGSRLMNEIELASPKAQDYLNRMSSAAERMTTLINDLLIFSRVSNNGSLLQPVALKDVLEKVLSDLELQIGEAQARFDIGELPVLEANASQLGQLFQNLISNSLKFRKTGEDGELVAPVIQITAKQVHHDELSAAPRPLKPAAYYHQIEVTDNGIGFDEIYLDRIFQVFQRLHGRSEYTGTGIGLAICERVVANLGGAITAKSNPGQGATFVIYLPAGE